MFICAKRSFAAFVLLAVGISGCAAARPDGPLPGPAAPKSEPAKQVDQRLTRGESGFGVQLLQALWAEAPGKNIFISPASVELALSMAMGGARGETQQAMLKSLGFAGMTADEVQRENRALQTVLANPDPQVEMTIANSLWYAQGFKLNPSFQQMAQQDYRAEVQPVTFGKPAAAQAINKWVAKATREKIKQLIDKTNGADRMYLVNAIYFNGKWQRPFRAENTRSQTFHLPGGKSKEVQMMGNGGHFRYLENDTLQAVALPYGDGRISMYVFLPKPQTDLDVFTRSMTPAQWETWLGAFADREGSLWLPKVKLEYSAELVPSLKTLGMGLAFDSARADFGGLFADNGEPLYVSRVIHKTFLDVNEKGTEAAAATAVAVEAGAAPAPKDRFAMVVDRPFLVAIWDDQTGALLFVGAIVDPT